MKEAFELHVAQDEVEFSQINRKLDHLLVEITVVKTQWKVVGMLAGSFAGIVGTIAAALLGSCT